MRSDTDDLQNALRRALRRYLVPEVEVPPNFSVQLSPRDGAENQKPRHEVELQTYYMDIFEVTYKQYKDCFKAGDCPKGGPFYSDFNNPNQPINGQTWIGADAYCRDAAVAAETAKALVTARRGLRAAEPPGPSV